MSSLRNAVKRITHKERSQPQSRSHLGILEKKKDYRVRARDYHVKEDRIRSLRRKAYMRNPDEFYFGMHRSRVGANGRHEKTHEARQRESAEIIGPDAVKIMKNQDLAYVRMLRQRDAKRVERMKESLHFVAGVVGEEQQHSHDDDNDNDDGGLALSKKRKHTIFVQSQHDAENFDVAKHFDTLPELAGRAFNRPRIETLKKRLAVSADEEAEEDDEEKCISSEKELAKRVKLAKQTARKVAKARASAYGELEARVKRMAALELAEAHLVTEKLVAGKGRKRKIKGAEDGKPAVYKWRRKRAK